MNLYKKIDSIFCDLSPSQKKLAIYLKENWEQVCLMTAKEFGEKVGVSEATVHRIARQLGYESFLLLKKDLRENYLNDRALVKLQKAEITGEGGNWLKQHFNNELSIIEKTSKMNSSENFDKAADIILSSERIWIAGWKLGLTITSNLRFVLNYMIGNCFMVDKAECSEYAVQIKEGDVLLVSGFQRYSVTTLKFAEEAKKRKAKIIVLTDSDLSPFAKYGDVNFYAAVYSSYFLDSYTAVLSVVNALISRIANSDLEKIKNKIQDIEQMYKTFEKNFDWQ